MPLREDIAQFLNDLGVSGLEKIIEMGKVEMFRNFMIQKYDWFVANLIPHSVRHQCEAAWYRFYLDHGRLPRQIDFRKILDETLEVKEVEHVLSQVTAAYRDQHGFDTLSPHETPEKISQTLTLNGF